MPEELYFDLDVLPGSVCAGDKLSDPIHFKSGVSGVAIQADMALTEVHVKRLTDPEQRSRLVVPKKLSVRRPLSSLKSQDVGPDMFPYLVRTIKEKVSSEVGRAYGYATEFFRIPDSDFHELVKNGDDVARRIYKSGPHKEFRDYISGLYDELRDPLGLVLEKTNKDHPSLWAAARILMNDESELYRHCASVGTYSGIISMLLGLEEGEQESLVAAGGLHGLGLVALDRISDPKTRTLIKDNYHILTQKMLIEPGTDDKPINGLNKLTVSSAVRFGTRYDGRRALAGGKLEPFKVGTKEGPVIYAGEEYANGTNGRPNYGTRGFRVIPLGIGPQVIRMADLCVSSCSKTGETEELFTRLATDPENVKMELVSTLLLKTDFLPPGTEVEFYPRPETSPYDDIGGFHGILYRPSNNVAFVYVYHDGRLALNHDVGQNRERKVKKLMGRGNYDELGHGSYQDALRDGHVKCLPLSDLSSRNVSYRKTGVNPFEYQKGRDFLRSIGEKPE